jgi:transcriptional regulator with XRE-family HTH domain
MPAMDVRHRLATNLRRLRTETGLSQEEFANSHDFDRTYISGIERAVRNPTIVVVERLAKALKVDVAELLTEPPAKSRGRKG